MIAVVGLFVYLEWKNEDKTFSRKTVTIYQIEIFEYKNLNKYKQGMEAYYKSVMENNIIKSNKE